MLVNFTFKNFRSFRDEKTLSMEASAIKELSKSVIRKGAYKLLPAAVLYGANSSGKSNALFALARMRSIVLDSVKLNPQDTLRFDPFMLDRESAQKPTSFEIQFLKDGVKYRYGFEYDKTRIISEWLYEKQEKEREFNLFLRAGSEFEISKKRFPEGDGKADATPGNRLFVSLCAQLNGKKSSSILDWFQHCNLISGVEKQGYEGFTLKMLKENPEGCNEAKDFFRRMQLGFKDLIVTEQPLSNDVLKEVPDELKEFILKEFDGRSVLEIKTSHWVYDQDGNQVEEKIFAKDEMESEGTKKVIELSGPLFDTLKEGSVLLVDELDAKLHPLLTRSILKLFMSPETNPNGAQLIFNTHDTNLLKGDYLRRDQIWFTEKDRTESSDLYSLIEFRDAEGVKVRKDRSFQNDYINGRYGAIPFIFSSVEPWDNHQKEK